MIDLDGYEVIDTLVETGTKVLIRARRPGESGTVVVKLLRSEYPSGAEVARLHHEHVIARHLPPEAVVLPLGVEHFKRRVGLVMEDVGGTSLGSVIADQALETGLFLRLALSLAEAVGGLHEAGVIHRDVKPSNVIVTGEGTCCRLVDFGIATRLPSVQQDADHPVGHLEGTLAYISPEQTGRMNRSVDQRSDLYSLGVTLYQMLTGVLPFRAADALELVHCHLAMVPVPPAAVRSSVPAVLSELVMRLLAKSPEDRYQSAGGLAHDLRQAGRRWEDTGDLEAFPLGSADIPGRLLIPERLYGREAEVASLGRLMADTAGGARLLGLLSGPGGIGKTALVGEMAPMASAVRAYFVGGKFDQYSRNSPYSALIVALGDLVRQLLAEPPERVEQWREAIAGALGPNVGVVAGLIPDLRLVVGEVAPVPDLGPVESQNRFNLVFRSFIDVFARPEHPLIIFLDDLHWADGASLKLLVTLLDDPDLRHLLIIGAYRPGEVSASHPLALALAGIGPASIHRVDVEALPAGSVTALLADTLHADPAGLDSILADRSGGNPFFLRHLLADLAAAGLVRPQGRRWTWDLEEITAQGLTDDVLAFMAGKLGALPGPTQETLRLAALAGTRFDLATVAAALGAPSVQVAAYLWPALAAGLVLPVGDGHELVDVGFEAPDLEYRFVHDRVQQACYATIPGDDLAGLHLRLGGVLREQVGPDDDRLFAVAEHLNAATELISHPGERRALAELNLRAARRAWVSAAYDTAHELLEAATRLLDGPAGSVSSGDLAFEVELLRGSVLAVLGRIDDADAVLVQLAGSVAGDLDFAMVCEARAAALEGAGRLAEVYRVAREGLARAGEWIPDAPEEVAALEARLRATLWDPATIARFATLPPAEPAAVLVSRLYARAFIGAYTSKPADLPLVTGLACDHVLRAGITPGSATTLGIFAMLPMMDGTHEVGVAYGRAAATIAELDYGASPRNEFSAWVFALSWQQPFSAYEAVCDRSFAACQAAGDFNFAMYSVWSASIAALVAARDCRHVLAKIDQCLDYGRRFVKFFETQTRIRSDCLRRLMGLERPPIDTEAVLAELFEASNFTEFAEAQEEVVRVAVLFGEYGEAQRHALRAEPYVRAGSAGAGIWNMPFYVSYAVACARLAAEAPDGDERAARLSKTDELVAWIAPFAELWPDNWASYHHLAVAERARAGGERGAAVARYQAAADHAAEHGYTLLEAWANELLGRLHHEAGRRFATGYLAEARALYVQCGAQAKADQVDVEFGPWGPVSTIGRFDDTRTTTDHGPSSLDLATVVKASEALASETAYDRVVERLVAISVENAGAERGVFLPAGGDGEPAVGEDVPGSLVRLVARTGQPVVIADATRDDTFARDPYVLARKPRSVAAGPISRQGRLLGVLYLENTLLAGAFSPERIELLRLLSAQMAISLDNARLYGRLEEEVAARTVDLSSSLSDLRDLQSQLVESEKLAALGGLVAGVAHEINTPVGVAVTAASHLTDRTGEFAAAYAAGPVRRSELERFTGTVRESATLILTNLERATDLVASFKQVAVDQSSEARRTFGVAAYLDDIVASLGPSLRRSPHRIDLDCDPGFRLTSYPGALAQVVTNLILNSVVHAYGEDEAGTLYVGVHTDEGVTRLVYADDGRGIPADVLPRIFDPFFTTRRGDGGSGLGLHVVHNLITQRLGGTVHVTSEPGAGTRFTITLPGEA